MDKHQNVDKDNKMAKEMKQKWLLRFLFSENDLFMSKCMGVCTHVSITPPPAFPLTYV